MDIKLYAQMRLSSPFHHGVLPTAPTPIWHTMPGTHSHPQKLELASKAYSQPTRGDSSGAAWEVGAVVPPPAHVLPGQHGDVVITKIRSTQKTRKPKNLSNKTQQFLRQQSKGPTSSTDPWTTGADPWATWANPAHLPATSTAMPSDKLQQVEQRLRTDIKNTIRKKLEDQHARRSTVRVLRCDFQAGAAGVCSAYYVCT